MILNPGTLIVPTKWNTTKRLKLCIVLGYDNGYYVSRALRSSLQKDFLDFFYCEINNYEEIPDSKITFRSFTEEKLVTAIRGNYMVDYPANKELQELYVGYRFIYSPADLIEYIDELVKISFSDGAPISELNDSTKDCAVCWLESYRRDIYVGYIDEHTEIR